MRQKAGMGVGTLIIIVILIAALVPRDMFGKLSRSFSKPRVIEIEILPVDEEGARLASKYKTEEQREKASLRRWRASLLPLDIGLLKGWTLLIDHRRQHPAPKFRPVKLEAIKYDVGSGLYLVGKCLKTNEQRHFGMASIYGYADASSNQEFSSFEEWAAWQGIEVDLNAQVERIEQREIERFRDNLGQ